MIKKEYPDEIKIVNRDGDTIRFIHEGFYKVELPNDLPVSVTYEEGGSIAAFDPSGGPFVTIGSTIEGYKVNHIEWSDTEKAFLVLLSKN